MNTSHPVEVFFNPQSIAIVGATNRPGTWGYFVMLGLTGGQIPGMPTDPGPPFEGAIYPVNHKSDKVFDLKAYKSVRDIPDPVDTAVVSVPEAHIEQIIRECGEKGIKGVSIITSGFGESVEGGKEREEALAEMALSYGTRLVGPNVGGAFNLRVNYNTTTTASDASGRRKLQPTPISAICQGGFAIFDLIISGHERQMGFGKFIQTGNECDLKASDFLEYFGWDPETECIAMYLEGVRNIPRFRELAQEITKKKPIVALKAGRTQGGTRAAQSHTSAMAGSDDIYQGLFDQTNMIRVPSMDLLLPLAHAAIELPPMLNNRVGIMTYGGSWGVPLTDALEMEGLRVPEFSPALQKNLHDLGLPPRASTKNPVDLGAAGMMTLTHDLLLKFAGAIFTSDEVDALILHGLGRPLMLRDGWQNMKLYMDFEKEIITDFHKLQDEYQKPMMIANHFNIYESQAVADTNEMGIRTYNRLEDMAQILSRMYLYWKRRNGL